MLRRVVFAVFAIGLCACATPSEAAPVTGPADFAAVLGDGWTGKLTYRDYSPPHGDVTLPVEATLTAATGGIRLTLRYPTEPHANSTELIPLAEDGRTLDGAPLVARVQRDDVVELTTRGPGQDDGRPATIEHTWSLGPRRLAVKKTVQFGDAAPLRRNEFVLNR